MYKVIVASLLFVFVAHCMGRRQKGYPLVLKFYEEHAHRLEYNVSFIIHMDFDHVWAEHHPITLNVFLYTQ